MATIDFGGIMEDVVTSEEFTLEKAPAFHLGIWIDLKTEPLA